MSTPSHGRVYVDLANRMVHFQHPQVFADGQFWDGFPSETGN